MAERWANYNRYTEGEFWKHPDFAMNVNKFSVKYLHPTDNTLFLICITDDEINFEDYAEFNLVKIYEGSIEEQKSIFILPITIPEV